LFLKVFPYNKSIFLLYSTTDEEFQRKLRTVFKCDNLFLILNLIFRNTIIMHQYDCRQNYEYSTVMTPDLCPYFAFYYFPLFITYRKTSIGTRVVDYYNNIL